MCPTAASHPSGCLPPRALLVHIAPERRWTRDLASLAIQLGGGADVHVPQVTVTGPLAAPPHIEHLARSVQAGVPLLLVGAGSGVTPGISLLRLLASRPVPPTARVRFVVVARSMAILEALDGFMLPTGPSGTTGLPWLTTELHLTRRVGAAIDSETGATETASPQGSVPLPHEFRGGFRLSALDGSDALTATSMPFAVVEEQTQPDSTTVRGAMPTHSRHLASDEVATLLGALGGFVGVVWPLLVMSGPDRSRGGPLSEKPTLISGTGMLLLAWIGALAGARVALLVADLAVLLRFEVCIRRHEPFNPAVREVSLSGSLDGSDERRSSLSGASPRSPDRAHTSTSGSADASAAEYAALTVTLASNGSRPDMGARLAAFAAQLSDHASDAVDASETGEAEPREMLVAAGGPRVLLANLQAALPAHLSLASLTHPM